MSKQKENCPKCGNPFRVGHFCTQCGTLCSQCRKDFLRETYREEHGDEIYIEQRCPSCGFETCDTLVHPSE